LKPSGRGFVLPPPAYEMRKNSCMEVEQETKDPPPPPRSEPIRE